jgi:hypothetical protein
MTSGPPSFGVNLMPGLWDGKPGLIGRELLARRRRLLGRMSEAGIDAVAEVRQALGQSSRGSES